MKYRHEERAEPLIKELCKQEAGIMRAEQALSKVDRDYIKFIRNMNIEKNRLERAALLYNSGKADGILEGEAKANIEQAQKMKALGFSAEQIHAVTGISLDCM